MTLIRRGPVFDRKWVVDRYWLRCQADAQGLRDELHEQGARAGQVLEQLDLQLDTVDRLTAAMTDLAHVDGLVPERDSRNLQPESGQQPVAEGSVPQPRQRDAGG